MMNEGDGQEKRGGGMGWWEVVALTSTSTG